MTLYSARVVFSSYTKRRGPKTRQIYIRRLLPLWSKITVQQLFTMSGIVLATCVLAALSQRALAAPVRVVDTDFPDPSVIKTDEGYYSFATAGNGVNTQIASSSDFQSWKLLSGQDAVPGPFPDWMANPPGIWAPDVIKRVFKSISTTDKRLNTS